MLKHRRNRQRKWLSIGMNLTIGSFKRKTQQNTNLIQHGEAIYVPLTYNTTNTPNKALFNQIISTHNHPFFCIELIHIFSYSNHNTFSYTYSFHILLSKTIINCKLYMHNFTYKFQCMIPDTHS